MKLALSMNGAFAQYPYNLFNIMKINSLITLFVVWLCGHKLDFVNPCLNYSCNV